VVAVADERSWRRRYACFNTVLQLSCPRPDDLLVFARARYGRNDTRGAARCRVPYDSRCEIDVQHSLSAVCGGHARCSLAVNTAFFDDPCGYDEFLYVNYICLPGIQSVTVSAFYRAMLCIRGTSHDPVSVCPSVCLSVCLSVRPSQVGVLLKRLNVGSHKQHHTIAQGL